MSSSPYSSSLKLGFPSSFINFLKYVLEPAWWKKPCEKLSAGRVLWALY